jgi:hypothetical protein
MTNARRRAARSLAEHEHNLALAQHQKQVDEAEHAVARAALAWCYEDGSAADLMRELRAACAAHRKRKAESRVEMDRLQARIDRYQAARAAVVEAAEQFVDAYERGADGNVLAHVVRVLVSTVKVKTDMEGK